MKIKELMSELEQEKYWDVMKIDGHFTLQLRQQHDLETCFNIRDEIISALKFTSRIKSELFNDFANTDHSIKHTLT